MSDEAIAEHHVHPDVHNISYILFKKSIFVQMFADNEAVVPSSVEHLGSVTCSSETFHV